MLHVAPTADLSSSFRAELRTFLDSAFDGDFTDDDWAHTIGGVHVWLIDGGHIISHGSVIERTLVGSDETLRAGYVEAVATLAAHRRKGYGATVMRQLNDM